MRAISTMFGEYRPHGGLQQRAPTALEKWDSGVISG